MKQLITLTVLLFSMFGIAKADEDKPIQVNELPKKAQEFIQKHCKYSEVPSAIVPKQIIEYVKKQHPQAKILQIERNSRGYEVELNNKLEIKFNLNFQVVEIDR